MLEREQKFYAYVVGADGKEYSITEVFILRQRVQ